MNFSTSNLSIIDFTASSLFNKIKNREAIDDTVLQVFYNAVVIDNIRTNHLKSEDERWVSEMLFTNKPSNKLLLNYLINFYQVFVGPADKEKLFACLKNEKQIAYCFLIAKIDLSVPEMQTLYNCITENWADFVKEEIYYENPYHYNFDNFQNSLHKRINKMERIGLSKLWLYILSTKAILGNNSNCEFFSKIKTICDQKIAKETNNDLVNFYRQNIFKSIPQ